MNITTVEVCRIKQTPENWDIYRWDDCDDPAFMDLIESVRAEGVLEPLVISVDHYVLSGHRRLRAAQAAGVEDVRIARLKAAVQTCIKDNAHLINREGKRDE